MTDSGQGDVNGVGNVDLDDFEIIRLNFFQSVTTHEEGDLNIDGTVDFLDFRIWKQFSATALATSAVPEPSGLVLAGLAAVTLGGRVACGNPERRSGRYPSGCTQRMRRESTIR